MSKSQKSVGLPSQPDQHEAPTAASAEGAARTRPGSTAGRLALSIPSPLSSPMATTADALRWALRRIETAGLGQGEHFERADALLASGEACSDLAVRDLIAAESRFSSIAFEVRCVQVLHDELFECDSAEKRDAFLTAAAALMRSLADHAEQGQKLADQWRERALAAEQLPAGATQGLDGTGKALQ